MLLKKQFLTGLMGLLLFNIQTLTAQYERIPYADGLKNSYFGADAGYIDYLPGPISAEKSERDSISRIIFPRHFIMAGYCTNVLGYGVNDFVANDYFSIFWGGTVKVRQGFILSYQRNVFHGRKVFAFDLSANTGFWETRDRKEWFFTVSLNPVFKLYALHSKSFDLFFEYSLAGPTFISKTVLDDINTGKKFTFHDFMGIGTFAGQRKKLYAGIRIAHFSNGDLFQHNAGVMVPLTFNLGYVLDL